MGVAVTDILTGLYSVNAILAALHLRDRTGRGQHIDMGLLDVATAFMANQAMNYLTTGVAPARIGNAHQNLTPYQVFDCADGWIIIATGNDAQYRRLCGLLGLDDMATAPEFLTNADRIANRDEMTRRLTEATLTRSKAELLAACEAHGVPAGPINDLAEVFADPQVIARGLRREADGVPGVRPPFRFSEAEGRAAYSRPETGRRRRPLRLVDRVGRDLSRRRRHGGIRAALQKAIKQAVQRRPILDLEPLRARSGRATGTPATGERRPFRS